MKKEDIAELLSHSGWDSNHAEELDRDANWIPNPVLTQREQHNEILRKESAKETLTQLEKNLLQQQQYQQQMHRRGY